MAESKSVASKKTLGYGLADSPTGQAAWILKQHNRTVFVLFRNIRSHRKRIF
jgi:hypothetical protein